MLKVLTKKKKFARKKLAGWLGGEMESKANLSQSWREAELGKKGDTQALKSKEKNFFLEFVSKPWFIILCVRNMTNVCGGNI